MQHAREMNMKSIHCIFLAPSADTEVGGEQEKGSWDSKNTPPLADISGVFKDRMAFTLPPFQNLELKVSKASSGYYAMLLEDKDASAHSSSSPSFSTIAKYSLILPHKAQPTYGVKKVSSC